MFPRYTYLKDKTIVSLNDIQTIKYDTFNGNNWVTITYTNGHEIAVSKVSKSEWENFQEIFKKYQDVL